MKKMSLRASAIALVSAAALASGLALVSTASIAGGLDTSSVPYPVAAEQWPFSGGDQAGTYFSALTDINDSNAGQLGFAWAFDMGTDRGQEATPLVIDGVMYTSGVWGIVYALEATTGKLLWQFDPGIDPMSARNACCDTVNRGIAYRDGMVFVASEDGKLHALDARTGAEKWQADTIINRKEVYASTGGVILTKDAVVIGNSGADLGDGSSRGYISAWDLKTGKFKWRFFTVPPAPNQPYEHPELEMAAKSWGPNRDGRYQNGGAVWDGLSYDPETDQIVFGTANASPYLRVKNAAERHDDLFNASIIAVNAQNGRMNWYYQETPGDSWDYDAVQKFIFANLPFEGQKHRVVMQASKNGFYYTLDLKTGKLLGADAYSYVNWAKGVDLKTGRPQFTETADYTLKPKNVYPSWAGAHTWNPMSFSPQSGLVYIPSLDVPNVILNMADNGGKLKHIEGFFNADGIIPDETYDPAAMKRLFGPMPDKAELQKERPGTKLVREILKAWDPVNHKIVWQQVTSEGNRGYDGGVLSTAGNVVVQGRGDGTLWVYNAKTGAPLKTIQTGSHIMAAPMTYKINGVQYVAVQVGYGGSGISFPIPPSSAAYRNMNTNRILVFKLGGGEVPQPEKRVAPFDYPAPPPFKATQAQLLHGEEKFTEYCSRCHGFGPGVTPDLSRLPPEVHAMFKDIVLKGALASLGMAPLNDLVSEKDVEDIHAYLLDTERQGYEAQVKAGKKPAK
ncbi:Pyrrolo-quinoline quinone [Novosphingobium nitrogenifigens DSM 19370]|uniref:Pyrrolo-quinoline quinone n=1 Tax=Novosphingobium nitrogenifigens DSM 19370 TaxID=983920 RepID=F1ZAV0_9SPHN|nr:PQQ-dependent dehydrogenase, methanol/ethanol family [Novosphingobium nitrogenifigens]EGD58272.1 Pyrrolo-quinoline quinone [Novosphingobium nitrogenifigens DSM 19370]